MTSQFSSNDNNIRQVLLEVKVAGLEHTQGGPKPASQRLWKTVEIRKTTKTWSQLHYTRKHLEFIYRCSTRTLLVTLLIPKGAVLTIY